MLHSSVICCNTMSAPLSARAESGRGPLLMPMVKQLAAEPARTPNGAFSTTMPCHGLLLPVLRSPIRYGSGFGLPRSTS